MGFLDAVMDRILPKPGDTDHNGAEGLFKGVVDGAADLAVMHAAARPITEDIAALGKAAVHGTDIPSPVHADAPALAATPGQEKGSPGMALG